MAFWKSKDWDDKLDGLSALDPGFRFNPDYPEALPTIPVTLQLSIPSGRVQRTALSWEPFIKDGSPRSRTLGKRVSLSPTLLRWLLLLFGTTKW